MRRRERRFSPAVVIAILALIAAVAGTAIAGPIAIKSVLNKKEKKQVKNIAKNQIKKLGPGLAVASAKQLTRVTVQQEETQIAANSSGEVSVACPAGQQALGGGYGTPIGSVAQSSLPSSGTSDPPTGLADNQSFNAWKLGVRNNNAATVTSRVWVVCAG